MANDVESTLDSTQQADISVTEIISDDIGDASPAVNAGDVENIHSGAILNIPVDMIISVGCAEIRLKDLSQMSRDSIFPLDTKVDDPVRVIVNGQTIALGILEENEDDNSIQVRITQIYEQ